MKMSTFNEHFDVLQSQISMTEYNQFIQMHKHNVTASGEAAEQSLSQQQYPSASFHLEVNKLFFPFT